MVGTLAAVAVAERARSPTLATSQRRSKPAQRLLVAAVSRDGRTAAPAPRPQRHSTRARRRRRPD